MPAKQEWLTVTTPGTDAPDYTSYSLQCSVTKDGPEDWKGDGSRWEFDHTSVQPDITAFELTQILSLHLSLPDGLVGRLKSHPRDFPKFGVPSLMRHFRHVPALTTEES